MSNGQRARAARFVEKRADPANQSQIVPNVGIDKFRKIAIEVLGTYLYAKPTAGFVVRRAGSETLH